MITEEQGLKIRKLRQQGIGYRAISTMLEIPRDNIREYCKNRGLAGGQPVYEMNLQDRIQDGTACAYCGGLIKKPRTGRPRKFCSELCRRSYWRDHRERIQKSETAIYTVECRYCGKIFESYGNRNRKYCCHEHYVLDRFGDRIK